MTSSSALVIVNIIILIQKSFCGIAEEKCFEYAKAVYVQEDSPTLMIRNKKNNISECGIASVPLIVGGTEANPKEFPHMAIIGFQSEESTIAWDCGGSLISDQFVLTAAHCLSSRIHGPAEFVMLGVVNLEDQNAEMRKVIDRISFPDYLPSKKINDIGLLKLNYPIVFKNTIRPACLNTNENMVPQIVSACGFGRLTYDSDERSKKLMKVSLYIYDGAACLSILPQQKVTTSIICAGYLDGGRDTCQGDSGGPLQTVLEKPYCMYNLVGVTSYGKFCGFKNSPAVYTKVASYVSWIESIVWK